MKLVDPWKARGKKAPDWMRAAQSKPQAKSLAQSFFDPKQAARGALSPLLGLATALAAQAKPKAKRK